MDIDFGYSNNVNSDTANITDKNEEIVVATDLGTRKVQHTADGDSIDVIDANSISDSKEASIIQNESNKNNIEDKINSDKKNNNSNEEITLTEGTLIEVGNDTYTIDKDGNLIDKIGNIFKESKNVKEWLDTFDKVDNDTNKDLISIDTIKETIGIEITDDSDKPIEFENTPNGVKSYIDAVIETSREEHFEAAINTLYQKYPIINDVLNYYIANGNSLEGFGEISDRSNITIDDTNETQQESIIRTAWKEQNRKGDVESYIQYLKSSGTLCAVSKDELAGMQESDKQYKFELEKQAEEEENKRIENLQNYWNGVNEVIKNRTIAGYKIPDTIIINKNGQKLSVTPNDFFNYMYQVDANGKSAYSKDLSKETPESRRDDEILRAYLKFVGGNYSSLVGMAVNKDNINTLKLKAKERTTSSVRINKPTTNTSNKENIDLGY